MTRRWHSDEDVGGLCGEIESLKATVNALLDEQSRLRTAIKLLQTENTGLRTKAADLDRQLTFTLSRLRAVSDV